MDNQEKVQESSAILRVRARRAKLLQLLDRVEVHLRGIKVSREAMIGLKAYRQSTMERGNRL